MIKLCRIFRGGYSPNFSRLQSLGYKLKRDDSLRLFIKTSSNHGFGQIKGKTQKKGVIYPSVEVSVFNRSTKALIWTTYSKQDGSYAFRNIAVGLECFVVGFDPEQNYNAVISDKLVVK